MTWASYSDDFTGRPAWDEVPYSARWHYLALVERCCRDHRWDGALPRQTALRVSDCLDPERDMLALETHGWVTDDGANVRVVFIDDHIPPPGQRPDKYLPRKRANQRAYRERRCGEGIHDRSCPTSCPERGLPAVRPVELPVTPGRVGSGRAGETPASTRQQTYAASGAA